MNRRHFSAAGAAAFAAGLAGAGVVHGEHEQRQDAHADHVHAHDGLSAEMLACAAACSDCARECEGCSTHCAKHVAEGHAKHLETLMTCRDCAELCSATARIVARGGPFAEIACKGCAEACKTCGDACSAFSDDEQMQQCAETCRACEAACRSMVKNAG
jgi:hypothetical protein